ncbi:uncharacterized protein PFL1_04727 [Pseudozyma flocculosa PF-1]|uniref:Related to SNG1 \|nr:uncharacterized protein PFL1_04727 [Pseudozyma flocculosa PF-1]EPQ27589.1 hypothetical protein PFL1_04727 [Pseudozyma flocculosa PF-1]SPO39284.1 related to SNG1 \
MSESPHPFPRPASISSHPARRSSLPGGATSIVPTRQMSRDASDSTHALSSAHQHQPFHQGPQHQGRGAAPPFQHPAHSDAHDSGKDIESAAGHNEKHLAHDDDDNDKDGQRDAAPRPRPASEGFWSPRLKAQRKLYLITMLRVTVAVSVVIWGIVSIFWGSVWKQTDLSPHLNGWIVNRDAGNTIGDSIQSALLEANAGPKPHVTWSVVDPARYPTTADLDYQVIRQLSTYIVVEVQANSTQRLAAARQAGDASWDPSSVVSLIYASGRNNMVVPSLVFSPAQQVVQRAITRLSSQLAADFFRAPPPNVAALVAAAPQTVASPIVAVPRDLRRFDQPVATAVLLVGLVLLLIMAFLSTMANFGARQPLQPFLAYRSLVAMRILVPLLSYFFISLMMTTLNVAFQLPYGRALSSYGAGFMTWWAVTFVGLAVLGLATECFISLVGPQFIGFCLVFFIVINVSTASLPIEVSPSFYRYGYAMPFYNLRSIYNIIIFDVGKTQTIAKYTGILLAWLVVILATFPIWIWLETRRAAKARSAQANKGAGPGGPQGGPPGGPRA